MPKKNTSLQRLPKAKELRPFVEKAITLARKGTGISTVTMRCCAEFTFAVRRHDSSTPATARSRAQQSRFRGKKGEAKDAIERTAGVKAVQRLFGELGVRYKDRNGGYTRIIKLGRRQGDNAEMAVIELVDNPRELAAKG